MSIADLGFRICQDLYQKLPAIVTSTLGTYGAARYISILKLPHPQASAQFASILAVAVTISAVLKRELKNDSPNSKVEQYLPSLTLYALLSYGLYSRVSPVAELWPFAKLCTVAFGSFYTAAYFTS